MLFKAINKGRLLIQKAMVYMYIVFIAISQYINLARKKSKTLQNKYIPKQEKIERTLGRIKL